MKETYSPSEASDDGSSVKTPLTIAPGKYDFLESRTVIDIQSFFPVAGFDMFQNNNTFEKKEPKCQMILL